MTPRCPGRPSTAQISRSRFGSAYLTLPSLVVLPTATSSSLKTFFQPMEENMASNATPSLQSWYSSHAKKRSLNTPLLAINLVLGLVFRCRIIRTDDGIIKPLAVAPRGSVRMDLFDFAGCQCIKFRTECQTMPQLELRN